MSLPANPFMGQQVYLTAVDPQEMSTLMPRWGRNSLYSRLLDTDPAQMYSADSVKKHFEKEQEKLPPDFFEFFIRTVDTKRIIGFVGLGGITVGQGDAWVGIGIGERDCWGKGYGTEAMRLVLHFGFCELNLQRVSLGVFAYNQRGIQSYIKAGFKEEGRQRLAMQREGQRNDIVYMGILRSEWLALQEKT